MKILKRTDPDSYFIRQPIGSGVANLLFGNEPRINEDRVKVLQMAIIDGVTIIFEVVSVRIRRITIEEKEYEYFKRTGRVL